MEYGGYQGWDGLSPAGEAFVVDSSRVVAFRIGSRTDGDIVWHFLGGL